MLRVLGVDNLSENSQLKLMEFLTTRHQFQASATQSWVFDHPENGEDRFGKTVMPFEIRDAIGLSRTTPVSIHWQAQGNQLTISLP